MKSRATLSLSLLFAVVIPFLLVASSGCSGGSDTLDNEVWTRQFGTPWDDNVHAMVADGSGNIYMVGATSGVSAGQTYSSDAFIAKYDASGNELWTRQFGTSGNDYVGAVVVDGSGNTYMAGGTEGTFPGQTSAGGADAFITKYDASGNEVWMKQFGTNGPDVVRAMVADGSGNIYVAGGTMSPDSATWTYTPLNSQVDDTFIAKYDASGNELWTRRFGTSGNDYVGAMVADGSGNIYIAGGTEGTFPGQTPSGGVDAFIGKYDASGNEIWMKQFGTGDFDIVRTIAADGLGNICIAGGTEGTFPGQTPSGGRDAFVTKYDASGDEISMREFGHDVNVYDSVMAVDGSGNVYVANTVYTYSFLSHDPTGSYIVFTKYDTSGKKVFGGQFGTGDWDYPYAIIAEELGNIYVAGRTAGTFPGQTRQGCDDVFITKLRNQVLSPQGE